MTWSTSSLYSLGYSSSGTTSTTQNYASSSYYGLGLGATQSYSYNNYGLGANLPGNAGTGINYLYNLNNKYSQYLYGMTTPVPSWPTSVGKSANLTQKFDTTTYNGLTGLIGKYANYLY